MQYWKDNVDSMIRSHGLDVLRGAGNHSANEAESIARKAYIEFNQRRKQIEKAEADAEDMLLVDEVRERLKGLRK